MGTSIALRAELLNGMSHCSLQSDSNVSTKHVGQEPPLVELLEGLCARVAALQIAMSEEKQSSSLKSRSSLSHAGDDFLSNRVSMSMSMSLSQSVGCKSELEARTAAAHCTAIGMVVEAQLEELEKEVCAHAHLRYRRAQDPASALEKHVNQLKSRKSTLFKQVTDLLQRRNELLAQEKATTPADCVNGIQKVPVSTHVLPRRQASAPARFRLRAQSPWQESILQRLALLAQAKACTSADQLNNIQYYQYANRQELPVYAQVLPRQASAPAQFRLMMPSPWQESIFIKEDMRYPGELPRLPLRLSNVKSPPTKVGMPIATWSGKTIKCPTIKWKVW